MVYAIYVIRYIISLMVFSINSFLRFFNNRAISLGLTALIDINDHTMWYFMNGKGYLA